MNNGPLPYEFTPIQTAFEIEQVKKEIFCDSQNYENWSKMGQKRLGGDRSLCITLYYKVIN